MSDHPDTRLPGRTPEARARPQTGVSMGPRHGTPSAIEGRMQPFAISIPVRREDVDLTHPRHAPALWSGLRRRYPGALACALAPQQIALVLPAPSGGDAQRSVASLMMQAGREAGLPRHSFTPVPKVRRIDGRDDLRRRVVEVWRAPLHGSALGCAHEPVWTTFRDLVGATTSPWVGNGALSRTLEVGQADLPGLAWQWAHARTGPPPPPSPIQARAWLTRGGASGQLLALAAAAATRTRPSAIRLPTPTRRVFLWLCFDLGHRDQGALARCCNTDEGSIARIARVVEGRALDAGLVCAADPRLTAELRRRQGFDPSRDQKASA